MKNKFLIIISLIMLFTGCSRNPSRQSRDRGNRETKETTEVIATEETSNDVHDVPIIPTTTKSKPTVNIYIENSGSMNGFINKTSEYQDAIQNMVVWLGNHYDNENIKLHYINERIILKQKPKNISMTDFIEELLSPDNFKSNGNGASTKLNSIISMILNCTNENNISILLSDNIFSISGSQPAHVLLAKCKIKMTEVFLEKMKELESNNQPSLSTTIIQLHSQFNGNYWDYKHPTGRASQQLNCKRPYYMCIIGVNDLVSDFNNKFDVNEMNGYKNKYTLTEINALNPKCSVLANTYKTGRFRKVNDTTIRDASNDKHKDKFALALAVDLKDIPLSDDEKCDVDLFEVTEGYVIDEIIKIDEATIAPIDMQASQNCTHIVKLSTSNYNISSFKLTMKRMIPEWIAMSSSIDDTQIGVDADEQNKTFGLSYFVNGIKEAYDKGADDYFEINIIVNK